MLQPPTMESTTQVRVAILEDHPLVRESLAVTLRRGGYAVVLDEAEAKPFLAALPVAQPAVALVDLTLETRAGITEDGFDVLREVRAAHPDVRTLVLSGNGAPEVVERCLDEGAAGYLHKLSANGEDVLAAVRAVANGARFFPVAGAGDRLLAPSTGRSLGPLSRLTAREREVLGFVAGGADNLKIASFLQITERTVKAHVSSLYRKLGSENRTTLALLARQLGIRPPPGL